MGGRRRMEVTDGVVCRWLMFASALNVKLCADETKGYHVLDIEVTAHASNFPRRNSVPHNPTPDLLQPTNSYNINGTSLAIILPQFHPRIRLPGSFA